MAPIRRLVTVELEARTRFRGRSGATQEARSWPTPVLVDTGVTAFQEFQATEGIRHWSRLDVPHLRQQPRLPELGQAPVEWAKSGSRFLPRWGPLVLQLVAGSSRWVVALVGLSWPTTSPI